MAEYDITNKQLAQATGYSENTISNWKNSKTLPGIGGERITSLCEALSKLAETSIKFSDLIEEV